MTDDHNTLPQESAKAIQWKGSEFLRTIAEVIAKEAERHGWDPIYQSYALSMTTMAAIAELMSVLPAMANAESTLETVRNASEDNKEQKG